MWCLFLLIFIDAAAGSNSMLFEYRIMLAGVPINALDILLVLALILVGTRRPKPGDIQTERPHPLLGWIIGLWLVAIAIGSLLGLEHMSRGVLAKTYLTTIRNALVIPLGVIVGYGLLRSSKSLRIWPYLQTLCGIGPAVMVLWHFQSRAQSSEGQGTEYLRTTDYMVAVAGMTAGMLLYSAVTGVRMFKPWLTLAIAGFCLVGNWATLSRSDWLASTAGVLVVFGLMPKGNRLKYATRGALTMILVAGVIIGAVYAASSITRMDFAQKMEARIMTLLPGGEAVGERKAWATRLGFLNELEDWAQNPILGRGITAAQADAQGMLANDGIGHNSWVWALRSLGLVGFTAVVLTLGACVKLGWKMVQEQVSQGTVLMGALGVVVGVHLAVLGMCTGGFNHQRGGLFMGLICGMIIRTRVIQQVEAAELAHWGSPLLTPGQYGDGYEEGDLEYGHPATPGFGEEDNDSQGRWARM